MGRLRQCREFVETREMIYQTADEIVQLLGVHALVDMLMEWADDAMHLEVWKALEDERVTARCTMTGVPGNGTH